MALHLIITSCISCFSEMFYPVFLFEYEEFHKNQSFSKKKPLLIQKIFSKYSVLMIIYTHKSCNTIFSHLGNSNSLKRSTSFKTGNKNIPRLDGRYCSVISVKRYVSFNHLYPPRPTYSPTMDLYGLYS